MGSMVILVYLASFFFFLCPGKTGLNRCSDCQHPSLTSDIKRKFKIYFHNKHMMFAVHFTFILVCPLIRSRKFFFSLFYKV